MNLLHKNAIIATCQRQLSSLFGNPLAYVFVLAFALVTAWLMFFDPTYFKRNIADLEPLRMYMLIPLAVLIPALSMGSWASERELGTEEQLLSLPMSVVDVLIGKWFGIAAFFTLTLLCSLCSVYQLEVLGDPDLGLVFSLYSAWWLSGLIFISLAMWASTMVSFPAIAFVIGVALTSLASIVMIATAWLDPFERGIIPISRIVMTVLCIVVPLSIAAFTLSMRRWQKKQEAYYNRIGIVVFCLCVTAFNITVYIDQLALDIDVTEEGLSSLSQASVDVANKIESPVRITAFISKDLPPELAYKGRELENMLQSIDREMGTDVEVVIKYPVDTLDAAGIEASQHHGIDPKLVMIDSVSGKQQAEVFLGAVVRSGAQTQNIPFFDPGLSVEFELVRAILTVGGQHKKTVGIVKTSFEVNGRLDYRSGRQLPAWQIVQEWKKQYTIRDVTLDAALAGDVDVLVVFQPSRLSAAELRHLHDAVWKGVSTLILEDPLPMWTNPKAGSSQDIQVPRHQQLQQRRVPPPQPAGDLKPLLGALGLSYPDDRITWSSYNPSHEFSEFPPEFVWLSTDTGSIQNHESTTGIQNLLMVFPGYFVEQTQKAYNTEGIVHRPLLTTAQKSAWGSNSYTTILNAQRQQPQYTQAFAADPILAIDVRGKMPTAFPTKKGEGAEQEHVVFSGTDVHVVLIADTDLAHNNFYQIYRNENEQYSNDGGEVLKNLRNVQFLSNVLDMLAKDSALMDLRNRRPRARPLTWMDKTVQEKRREKMLAIDMATKDADARINSLSAQMKTQLERIAQRTDIDEDRRRQLHKNQQELAQKDFEQETMRINKVLNDKVRLLRSQEREDIRQAMFEVKVISLARPSIVVILLILAVFVIRMRRESSAVPQRRSREDGRRDAQHGEDAS